MKVVLTTPATEMSEYNGNPAIAFVSGFSKPFFIPRHYLLTNLYRPVDSDETLRVVRAPLGLRRIEASLIHSGLFNSNDVAIVHPDHLEDVVRENTRIVGISVKDPLGLGYVSLTYSTLLGLGEPINKFEFMLLMRKVKRLKEKYRFRVVVGGPGVWQFRFLNNIEELGIDVLISGEGERVAPSVFAKLARGENPGRLVKGGFVPVENIPHILGATICGAVEVSRGCGRGCMFCTPTMLVKRDIPLEVVTKDIETNLRQGQDRALLVTEDLFLYGSSPPWEPNESAVTRLVNAVIGLRNSGLRYLQITHMNLAAIRYRKELFKNIADKLHEFAWFKLRGDYINTVEVGIESGSPRIIGKLMRGKVLPYKPEEWPSIVLESLILMEECGWVPLATLIVGLPGEDIDDALKTLALIDSIREHGLRPFMVPLLFVPLGGSLLENRPIKSFDELSDVQLEIFSNCWRHNLRNWGIDHFENYGFAKKTMLSVLARLYLITVARRYRWRERIAKEIYRELARFLHKGVGVDGKGV
ncbi:MAG: radical SAM protein [Desulfurococcaceae archaeon]